MPSAVTVSVAVASNLIFTTVTPPASGGIEGDVTVSVTVAAGLVYTNAELTGDVDVTISVRSGMVYTPDRSDNIIRLAIPPIPDPTITYDVDNERDFRRRMEEALVDVDRVIQELLARIS